jgi:salicylate hydroxylase
MHRFSHTNTFHPTWKQPWVCRFSSKSTKSSTIDIAVIGAGIGGLATANALMVKNNHGQDKFFNVRVYEQASNFVPTAGAGFGFSPNGQICLESIGVSTQDMLHQFDSISRLDRATGAAVQQSSSILKQIRDKYGFGMAGCLRADLIDRLLESLQEKSNNNAVNYSHQLTSVQPKKDKVTLEFANGHVDDVDLVVGADGIHSFVAKELDIDHSDPIYSGANIFYGILDDVDSIPPFEWQSPLLQDFNHSILQGHDVGEFIVFKVGPMDKAKLVWAATYPSGIPPPRRQEWDAASHMVELQTVLPKFPPTHIVHELAEKTGFDRLLHFGLYYRKHKTTWFKDRVCLLGDSCHATLPYVGQGANQAIEDAISLADCLDEYRNDNFSSHTAAFNQFYDQRFTRTKRIVTIANIMDKMYHSNNFLVKIAMDLLLSQVLKGGIIFKQIEKEIVEECPVKDYAKYAARRP